MGELMGTSVRHRRCDEEPNAGGVRSATSIWSRSREVSLSMEDQSRCGDHGYRRRMRGSAFREVG